MSLAITKLGFSDNEVSCMNELRYFRNSVAYYGKLLGVEYAKKVTGFAERIYPKLIEIANRQEFSTSRWVNSPGSNPREISEHKEPPPNKGCYG